MTSIAATGQLLLHGRLDFATPGAARLQEFLRGADASMGNLEATVESPGAWPTKTKTLHLAAASALQSVRDLGFDVATHANNHAFDLGPPGIVSTRAAAEAASLAFTGSGVNIDEAARPAFVDANGHRIAVLAVDLGPQGDIVYASSERAGVAPLRMRRTIAIPDAEFDSMRRVSAELGDDLRERSRSRMGYRQEALAQDQTETFGQNIRRGKGIQAEWSPHAGDWAAFEARLTEVRKASDLVAISVHSHHWDPDWGRTPQWLHALACSFIDLGAHMVVGTGSPVLQPVAFHRGRPILGGLGNLIFHTQRSATYDREGVDVWTGAACRAEFDATGQCHELSIMPVAVGRPDAGPNGLPMAPQALEGDAARVVFNRMSAGLGAEARTRVVLAT